MESGMKRTCIYNVEFWWKGEIFEGIIISFRGGKFKGKVG
jgi:hypothetical protein